MRPICNIPIHSLLCLIGNLKRIFLIPVQENTKALARPLWTGSISRFRFIDNVIETANDNLKPLHRWAALKKEILGIKELHPYDAYVTLFQQC